MIIAILCKSKAILNLLFICTYDFTVLCFFFLARYSHPWFFKVIAVLVICGVVWMRFTSKLHKIGYHVQDQIHVREIQEVTVTPKPIAPFQPPSTLDKYIDLANTEDALWVDIQAIEGPGGRPMMKHILHFSDGSSNTYNIFHGPKHFGFSLQPGMPDFGEFLKQTCDKTGVIVLIFVDNDHIDMAINFYETSLVTLGISNYCFLTFEKKKHNILRGLGINTFLYRWSFQGSSDILLGLRSHFENDLNSRYMIDILNRGYSVLRTDPAMIFVQSPLDDIQCKYGCDMVFEDNGYGMSHTFYFAVPTPATITFHKLLIKDRKNNVNKTADKIFNDVYKKMTSENKLQAKTLPWNRYPNGAYYYENGKRLWADDDVCYRCVSIHNNWMMTYEGQRYRFKEHQQWMVDNNGYYSKPNGKFITYNNPVNPNDKDLDINALANALYIAHLLNRTVIFPRFHCVGCHDIVCKEASHCPLNVHLSMKEFDSSFGDLYRESTFLTHPKVPRSIRKSKTGIILIDCLMDSRIALITGADVVYTFTPKQKDHGATAEELISWFKGFNQSVLHFHSLYQAVANPLKFDKNSTFAKRLKVGFKDATYRQY